MFKLVALLLLIVATSTVQCFTRGIIIEKFYDIIEKPTDHAKVARELVHKSQWAPFSTISSLSALAGAPMVNTIAIADGPAGGQSTGNIYFYLTDLDYTGQDLAKRNVVTALFSNDIDLACDKESIDAMEPTCARAIISGTVDKLEKDTDEYTFAKEAFESRHPAVVHWIAAHTFYLCKMNIQQIYVLDWYGGPHTITPEEYYNVIL